MTATDDIAKRLVKRRTEIKALTGLRGIAAWWVVLYHFREYLDGDPSGPIQLVLGRGYLAVDLFFILSGFVIHRSYGSYFTQYSPREFGSFLLMRLGRVYPAHLTILFLYLSVPLAIFLRQGKLEAHDQYELGYFLLSVGLAQNWGFTETLQWNVPAWSISTEIVSYVAFPTLAYVLAVSPIPSTAWSLLISSLAGVAVVFSVSGADSLGTHIVTLGLIRCLFEFAAGVAIAAICREGMSRGFALWSFPVAVLTTLMGYATGLADYYFIPLALTFLIFSLANSPPVLLAGVLGNGAVYYLGVISYSTYISHYLVKRWVLFILARDEISTWIVVATYVSITFLVSIILFKVIEDPMRRHTKSLANRFLKNSKRLSAG